MGYSLGRKTGSRRRPYTGYLRSGVWAWRRQRWFRDCRKAGSEPACQVCRITLTAAGSLDLHHTSYDGVHIGDDGSYRAGEADTDLLPFCRDHHEALHRFLDDRRGDYWGWERRRATVVITAILARKHQRTP
jgi:thiosulfate reductase electron transport protein